MASWGATEAKARFSAVLDKAETEEPQLVERRKKRFVLLTEEELERRTSDKGMGKVARSGKQLWDALRLPPEARVDNDFPRLKWSLRKVDF